MWHVHVTSKTSIAVKVVFRYTMPPISASGAAGGSTPSGNGNISGVAELAGYCSSLLVTSF
jgi:hypothetical protein